MAGELIYTSAPRGLRAGTSGYCTVAQSRGLREDLAAALERRSFYAHEIRGESPDYFSFRNLSLGGSTWRVLSRGRDAGLDFTGRRHFLIHHLVLDPGEATGGAQPVDFLLGWKGWKDKWEASPTELPAVCLEDVLEELPRIRLPAQEWRRLTGDAGWATAPYSLATPLAWLTESPTPQDLLRLMGESLAIPELRQAGKSWLYPLDVGGVANPVPKDCLWAGRISWRGEGSPTGVRSVLRVEKCRGKRPEGRPEEMVLARAGRLDADPKRTEPVLTSLRPDLSAATLLKPAQPESPNSWAPPWRWFMLIFFVVVGGVAWWQLRTLPSSPTLVGSEASVEAVPVTRRPEPMRVPSPSTSSQTRSPGENLREILWGEAGGRETIAGLHLLYGKSISSALIEGEVKNLWRDGAEAGSVRGPEGMISLKTKEERKRFGKEAAKRQAPWTLFVPEAQRGLIYLPDLGGHASQRIISAQGCPPQMILDEVTRSIFLAGNQLSLLIQFPDSEGKSFMPLRIKWGEDDARWIDRLNQHRAQLWYGRKEALRRLAPLLRDDPDQLDEAEIRRLLKENRGAEKHYEEFAVFQRLNADYQRWWAPPEPDCPPGEVFRRLLANPGVVCFLELDGLAVSRVNP